MTITGSYEKVENRPAVRFERTFAHPPEAVWAAITDPGQLAQWFPSTIEFETLEAGAPIRYEFPGHDLPAIKGEFLHVEPDRKLVMTWGDDELSFELEPREGGCRLRFTVLLDGAEKAARDAAGWEVCLDELANVVAGDGTDAQTGTKDAWRGYYEEYRERGLPATAPLPE